MRDNIIPVNVTLPFNLAAGLVKASAVLTSDESQVTADDTVTVGEITYTFVDDFTAAVASTGALTSDNTKPTAGKIVTVGSQTYTFVAALTATPAGVRSYIPNEVLIGANADAALTNLAAAINCTNGDENYGVTYSKGTQPNPEVTSSAVVEHAITVTARVPGTDGDDIAKYENDSHLDWDGTGATLTGGVDTVANEVIIAAYAVGTITATSNGNPSNGDTINVAGKEYTFVTALTTDPGTVANEILIGSDGEDTLKNLRSAINGTAGAGTKYGTGTVKSTLVTAAAPAVDTHATMVVTSILPGTVGEYALTEDATNITVSAATLEHTASSGSADTTLANLVKAINGTGTEGIEYSVGTEASPVVTAGAVTAHASTMEAKVGGVAGNLIAKAEDAAHLDWDGSGEVFSGGGGTKAKYEFTGHIGFAHRFILKTAQMTGSPTVKVELFDKNDVLVKTIAATAAENALTDTAYETEIAHGDYILLTASGTVSDAAAEAAILQVR